MSDRLTAFILGVFGLGAAWLTVTTPFGANASHRATQASPQAPTGLGHSVSVTFAGSAR